MKLNLLEKIKLIGFSVYMLVAELRKYLLTSNSYYRNDTKKKIIAQIINDYHIIEKGLTMPEMRLGFGIDILNQLMDTCNEYDRNYEDHNLHFLHAISVIFEYEELHKSLKYELDIKLTTRIQHFRSKYPHIKSSCQKTVFKENVLSDAKSDFEKFSSSRHSLRNFTNESIPIQDIKKAIILAQNAPSACNRQPSRVYIIRTKSKIKEILKIQRGNRGFGHLFDTMLIVCGELSVFNGVVEKNEIYTNGGMFAMNLLYALHYYEIGTTTLNWSVNIKEDKKLCELVDIPRSQKAILIIGCGRFPEKYKIALSPRHNYEEIIEVI